MHQLEPKVEGAFPSPKKPHRLPVSQQRSPAELCANHLQPQTDHGQNSPTLGKQAGKRRRRDGEKGACKLAESLSQSTAKERGK